MSELRDPVKLFGWTITSYSSPVLQDLFDDHRKDNTSSTDLNNSDEDDQHSEITTTSEEKTTELKKPDKILPCPRCKSGDTKFCYYNNYNVNQPRHFCRNCQRYWTAGGSRRTIPVGSGRRKTKTWVSSLNIDTSNHNTNILSFESSDSLVSQKLNNFKGFLPQQVTSLASLPNASFYPIPVYWGCTVPFWSTLETSTCLEKKEKRRRFT